MALRSDWSNKICPAARAINVLGDPWVLLILREVLSGVQRFDTLKAATGAADNILSNRLSAMTAAGLITREPYEEGERGRSNYAITDAGADALPILHALAIWGHKHAPRDDGSPKLRIFCQHCSTESTTGEACSTCGHPLTAQTTAWIRPHSPSTQPHPLTPPREPTP